MRLALDLAQEDINALVHHCLMANIHGKPKPETAYQFKILKAVILQNDSARCLDSVEIRQTWPDKASERLLDNLLEDESFYEAFFASER